MPWIGWLTMLKFAWLDPDGLAQVTGGRVSPISRATGCLESIYWGEPRRGTHVPTTTSFFVLAFYQDLLNGFRVCRGMNYGTTLREPKGIGRPTIPGM